MIIEDVHRGIHPRQKRKRKGRGRGAGTGKTSGRGHNGQKSRAGASNSPAFEGGQSPLYRRIAKRGFSNRRFEVKIGTVNLGAIDRVFEATEEITPASLRERALVPSKAEIIKVLGDGQLTKPFRIRSHRFSKSALAKIEACGGSAVTLAPPRLTGAVMEDFAATAESDPFCSHYSWSSPGHPRTVCNLLRWPDDKIITLSWETGTIRSIRRIPNGSRKSARIEYAIRHAMSAGNELHSFESTLGDVHIWNVEGNSQHGPIRRISCNIDDKTEMKSVAFQLMKSFKPLGFSKQNFIEVRVHLELPIH